MSAISIHTSNDITLMKIAGEFRLEDITSTLEKFYSGNPTKHVVWDFSEADTASVQSSDAKLLTAFVTRFHKNREQGKTAIIAPADLQYGVGRIFDTHADLSDLPFAVSTFRSYQEAEQWLGMPIPGNPES